MRFLIIVLLSFPLLACGDGKVTETPVKNPGNSYTPPDDTPYVLVDFDRSASVTSNYLSGVTHTQYSVTSGNATAMAKAKEILQNGVHFQNQHIMGWGALNVWPDSTITDPARWEWNSVDKRIELMRETGAVKVITFCGCPTWMHSPDKNGTTDWNELETAPHPSRYAKFAHLCAETARRYPDVEYFQVWNEMKGFYDRDKGRWNYENYTRMYNMVYDAVKEVRPAAKIGGPYVHMDSYDVAKSYTGYFQGKWGYMDKRSLDVVTYWLANKKGGDFIVMDGGTRNKEQKAVSTAYEAIEKLEKIYAYIRAQPNGGATLPMWWSEFYVYPNEGFDPVANDNICNSLSAAAMIRCILAGYETLLLWGPESTDQTGTGYPISLWTRTNISSGGAATSFTPLFKTFHDRFSKGTKLYKPTLSDASKAGAIATDTHVMFVNQTNAKLRIVCGGDDALVLNPYQVYLAEKVIF